MSKSNYQRGAWCSLFAVLIGIPHFVSAQPATVIQADQQQIIEIIVASDGSVRANLGRDGVRPARVIPPEYPVRARQRRIAGWNLLKFSIDGAGYVEDESIVVVDSEPPGVFDEASIRSISELFFGPRLMDGVETRTEDLQIVYRYVLTDNIAIARMPGTQNRDYLPLNFITPEYPAEATEEGVEGFVLLEFTVSSEGLPTGIVIIDRSPSSIFNASAVAAAERFRFEPRIMDGVPVEAQGARHLFSYKLDD